MAKATIDQFAVRIALQCSEADSRLILRDDNPAARLLERSGDAIYNDANGNVEGNSPFHVAWLGEEERNGLLGALRTLADVRGYQRQPVVFEGRSAAHMEEAEFSGIGSAPGATSVWLGDRLVVSKTPVQVTFRAAPGSNLLIVGQDPAAATGLMAAVVVSVAIQHGFGTVSQPATCMYFIDGTAEDSETRLPAQLAPSVLRRVSGAQVAGAVQEILNEITRRGDSVEAPWFLLIHGLQFFRKLRRSADEPLFRRPTEPVQPNPHADLMKILREGPAVGVHTCIWCDSLTNLNRSLDRTMLDEFAVRVIFQMPPTDSTALIDIPGANKLGNCRAYFYDDARGVAEKFRPYGVPSEQFMASHVGLR